MDINKIAITNKEIKPVKGLVANTVVFMIFSALTILGAIAAIIVIALGGVTDWLDYATLAMSIALLVFNMFVLLNEYKLYTAMLYKVALNETFVYENEFSVNPGRKTNVTSVLYLVCSVVMFVALIGLTYLAIVSYQPEVIVNIVLVCLLSSFVINQFVKSVLFKKIYTSVILTKK